MPTPLQTLHFEEDGLADELAVDLEPIEDGSLHILAQSAPAGGAREMRAHRDSRRWIMKTAPAALALVAIVIFAGAWMWRVARADLQESTNDLNHVALKYAKHAKHLKKKKKASKADEGVCSKAFQQCGGTGYEKAGCCESGCICMPTNDFYSQCSPPDKAAQCDPALAKKKLDNWTKEAEIVQKIADNATGHLSWLEDQVNKLTGSSEWWSKKAAKSADGMGHLQWQMNEAAKKAAGNFSVEDGCSEALTKCSGKGGCCQQGCSCVDMGGWSQCHPASKGATCWAVVREEGKAVHAQKVKEFETAKAAADKDAAELETRNQELEKFRADKELAEKDAEEKKAKAEKYNEKVQKWKDALEGEAKAKAASAAAAKAEAVSATKKKHSTAAGGKKKMTKKVRGHKKEDEDAPKVEADEDDDESEESEEEDKDDEEVGGDDDDEEDEEDEDGGDKEEDEKEEDESEEQDTDTAKGKKDDDDEWAEEDYGEEDE